MPEKVQKVAVGLDFSLIDLAVIHVSLSLQNGPIQVLKISSHTFKFPNDIALRNEQTHVIQNGIIHGK